MELRAARQACEAVLLKLGLGAGEPVGHDVFGSKGLVNGEADLHPSVLGNVGDVDG